MTPQINKFGQPIGSTLPDWQGALPPPRTTMMGRCCRIEPLFHAIVDKATDQALGLCAFLRIKPAVGVIEVGSITFAPALQQTVMATEAMYLMMSRVFDELGYRRYEWKCDALNEPSRNAATRLGFSFEGTFAQAMVYKGRNRDTAWFAMLDKQWPQLKRAYLQWLDPANFGTDGMQKTPLSSLLNASEQKS